MPVSMYICLRTQNWAVKLWTQSAHPTLLANSWLVGHESISKQEVPSRALLFVRVLQLQQLASVMAADVTLQVYLLGELSWGSGTPRAAPYCILLSCMQKSKCLRQKRPHTCAIYYVKVYHWSNLEGILVRQEIQSYYWTHMRIQHLPWP